MITPVDLETTVFRRGFRGYSTSEVQEFMVRITHDYEHLYRENIELKEKIEALQNQLSQYQVMEETLRNAMILAQESADEVKNLAQSKADLIIREAEQRGEHIKARLKEEIQLEIQKLTELKQQVEFFKCQFKSFLTSLMEIAEHKLDLHIPWDKILASTQPVVEECPQPEVVETEKVKQIAETATTVEKEAVKAWLDQEE
ncbi:MAG TPA: DivIVA domain-containing protein [Bacillota bacterium]|nr:DivIVA domain-containing protein [Bacillota bacterium]